MVIQACISFLSWVEKLLLFIKKVSKQVNRESERFRVHFLKNFSDSSKKKHWDSLLKALFNHGSILKVDECIYMFMKTADAQALNPPEALCKKSHEFDQNKAVFRGHALKNCKLFTDWFKKKSAVSYSMWKGYLCNGPIHSAWSPYIDSCSMKNISKLPKI